MIVRSMGRDGGAGDRLGMAGLERSCQCRVLVVDLCISRRGSWAVVTASLGSLLFCRHRGRSVLLGRGHHAHRALALVCELFLVRAPSQLVDV